jgi:hypothetical protein
LKFEGLDERPSVNNLSATLSARHSRGEDAMPFKVIFFRGNDEIGSNVWETKKEAVDQAKMRPLDELTSVIVVDDDTSEIVLTEQAKESKDQVPVVA